MFTDHDFSWDYFFLTGNIDAYLLSKELEQYHHTDSEEEGDSDHYEFE